MTIRSILLHVAAESCDPKRSAARYAIGLADAYDAHLDALVFELDVVTPKSFYGRQIAADAASDVDQRNAEIGSAADSLRQAAAERGVDARVITDRSHAHSTPEIATDHARLADIVVAGVCEDGLLSERMVAEVLIFQSGRPVIIVPTGHEESFSADHILVAWDHSRVAARALGDAMPLLRRASHVTIVSFGDDKAMESSLSPEDLRTALRQRGVRAQLLEGTRADSDIADAIHAVAAEVGADMLVMGGFGHSRFRDFVLGGATRAILSAPQLPTLISH